MIQAIQRCPSPLHTQLDLPERLGVAVHVAVWVSGHQLTLTTPGCFLTSSGKSQALDEQGGLSWARGRGR